MYMQLFPDDNLILFHDKTLFAGLFIPASIPVSPDKIHENNSNRFEYHHSIIGKVKEIRGRERMEDLIKTKSGFNAS